MPRPDETFNIILLDVPGVAEDVACDGLSEAFGIDRERAHAFYTRMPVRVRSEAGSVDARATAAALLRLGADCAVTSNLTGKSKHYTSAEWHAKRAAKKAAESPRQSLRPIEETLDIAADFTAPRPAVGTPQSGPFAVPSRAPSDSHDPLFGQSAPRPAQSSPYELAWDAGSEPVESGLFAPTGRAEPAQSAPFAAAGRPDLVSLPAPVQPALNPATRSGPAATAGSGLELAMPASSVASFGAPPDPVLGSSLRAGSADFSAPSSSRPPAVGSTPSASGAHLATGAGDGEDCPSCHGVLAIQSMDIDPKLAGMVIGALEFGALFVGFALVDSWLRVFAIMAAIAAFSALGSLVFLRVQCRDCSRRASAAQLGPTIRTKYTATRNGLIVAILMCGSAAAGLVFASRDTSGFGGWETGLHMEDGWVVQFTEDGVFEIEFSWYFTQIDPFERMVLNPQGGSMNAVGYTGRPADGSALIWYVFIDADGAQMSNADGETMLRSVMGDWGVVVDGVQESSTGPFPGLTLEIADISAREGQAIMYRSPSGYASVGYTTSPGSAFGHLEADYFLESLYYGPRTE